MLEPTPHQGQSAGKSHRPRFPEASNLCDNPNVKAMALRQLKFRLRVSGFKRVYRHGNHAAADRDALQGSSCMIVACIEASLGTRKH